MESFIYAEWYFNNAMKQSCIIMCVFVTVIQSTVQEIFPVSSGNILSSHSKSSIRKKERWGYF